jgi:enamine deaminase RidA (YjgF/YER057c/UK114 family)
MAGRSTRTTWPARRAPRWRSIETALAAAGFALGDVVRTRMFVTDITRAAEVTAIHGQVFEAIRPVATLVEVTALIDPSLLIEIEAEARRS